MSDQEAGTETTETGEQDSPQTSSQELENGLFSLMITLIQWHMSQGMNRSEACEMVATALDRYARALRQN